MLSQRALNLKSSPTLALVAKTKELQAKGHDVISLTVGEPDWETYRVAKEAGIKAIETGFTKYTASQGTLELRTAISQRCEKDLGLKYSPQTEISVTSGAKFSIFSALQVLCDHDDEVIIPSPFWVSYPAMAELAGAKPKIIYTQEQNRFKLTAEEFEKNITEKTKVFLFCSPSNPTGLIYTEEELRSFADILRKHPRICVISDDMYNLLMLNGMRVAPHLLQVAPDLRDRTVIINGGSKAFAMTGWRIGWAMGPQQVIKAISDFASQATGAPSSISQKAAEAALTHVQSEITETCHLLKERLESALKELSQIQGLQCLEPDGAFYLWVNIKNLLGRQYHGVTLATSQKFCEILLTEYFVSTVPGEEFGHEGFIRFSFAIQTERFNEALQRMKTFISLLSV